MIKHTPITAMFRNTYHILATIMSYHVISSFNFRSYIEYEQE